MTTEADIGYGTWMKQGDGGSPTEVFTDLGVEITNVSLPAYTRDAIDASHMQSPDQFREFIAGMMDAGEVSFECAYVPTAEDVIIAALLAGKKNYRIGNDSWPAYFTISAICTNFAPTAPMDDKMTASATFKVSGKPTLTAA